MLCSPAMFLMALVSMLPFAGVLNADTAQIPEDKSNFHIFLLMGQSNMEGGNSIDGEMDTETDSRF